MKMVGAMRASGAGVVVLSCADPRIAPDKILGLDETLSMTSLTLNLVHLRRRGVHPCLDCHNISDRTRVLIRSTHRSHTCTKRWREGF